jgi:hypothetical protein
VSTSISVLKTPGFVLGTRTRFACTHFCPTCLWSFLEETLPSLQEGNITINGATVSATQVYEAIEAEVGRIRVLYEIR